MEFRNLGNSGLKVSVAGLGCNNFGMRIDQEMTDKIVGKALDEDRWTMCTAQPVSRTRSIIIAIAASSQTFGRLWR